MEGKSEMQTKQVYTGIDYVRVTALDHEPVAAWEAIVLPEYMREERAGRKPHFRWMLGYYGRVGEHCFVGKNEGGAMIQLSGALAWSRWYDATSHSPRTTRLDLQVTWPTAEEPGEYIREMYAAGQLHKGNNGRPASLQLLDTPEGAKMLTIGSRQSELYGRMYDKFRESKMPEYKSCVRWELEVKGEQAYDLSAYMREHRSEAGTTRAIVKQFFEKRGMTPFWDTYEALEGVPPVKRSKTDETKLAWLATQVRPSLQTLTEHGRIFEVVRALFGQDMPDERVAEVVRLLTESDQNYAGLQ
jgi:DNA relaxase NicK